MNTDTLHFTTSDKKLQTDVEDILCGFDSSRDGNGVFIPAHLVDSVLADMAVASKKHPGADLAVSVFPEIDNFLTEHRYLIRDGERTSYLDLAHLVEEWCIEQTEIATPAPTLRKGVLNDILNAAAIYAVDVSSKSLRLNMRLGDASLAAVFDFTGKTPELYIEKNELPF